MYVIYLLFASLAIQRRRVSNRDPVVVPSKHQRETSWDHMSLTTNTTRLFAATFLMFALNLIGANPAMATVSPSGQLTATTTGAKATCSLQKTAVNKAKATCTLFDTKADGYSVYIRDQVLLFPEHRWSFSGGAGKSTTNSWTVQSDTLQFNWHFRVCRQVELGSDNCSGWVYFYVS